MKNGYLKKYIIGFGIALATLAITGSAFAQALVNKPIYLKGDVVVVTSNNIEKWVSGNKQTQFPVQVLIQFNSLPDNDAKDGLMNDGVALQEYLSDKAYMAIISKTPEMSSFKNTDAKFITEVKPDWKLDTEVKQLMKGGGANVSITVTFAGSISEPTALTYLKERGATVLQNRMKTMGYCHVSVPVGMIPQLAAWYGITYINRYVDDAPLNINAKSVNRGQVAAAPLSVGGYNLRGKGVAVGVGDNTSGIFHIDLADRIINFNPQGYTNHGVHINGIVGGAGIIDPKGEGTAPLATLTNHLYSDVLDATPSIYQDYKVVATNNSYSAYRGSCEYAGTYDGLSVGLDKLCLGYDKVLQVFAAANDGLFDCQPYPKGFATIAGGYQAAKNAIVVASTNKQYVNADNSSRGPLRDGRLKPEITAVGVDVNSTTRSEEYLVASGTSMACPQVAGAAALITERWKQVNGANVELRSDLLKALLINGATDIGTPGPDYRFGFGFLNIERSLKMVDNNRLLVSAVNNNEQRTFQVTVPPDAGQLKILLYWHDQPASAMAAKQLVNDLDVQVIEPGGKSHNPLVLDPTPEHVLDAAVEKVDRLNNCEQVVIDTPAAGSYTINVNGFEVISDNQPFVIVYDFLPKGISIKYPLAETSVKADDTVYVYWDALPGTSAFTLEYSTDNGSGWAMLDNNIPAEQRHFLWDVPENINSGDCRLRLRRIGTGEEFVTGLFIINTQPVASLSSTQCPGYIRVEWGATPNATAYEVMRKLGPEMVVADTVTTTEYTFSGLALDSNYFVAVRPVINGLSGYRSLAVSRKPNDGDCNGDISDGDLMIDKILSPQTGRLFTSTELSSAHLLKVRLRNLDDMSCDSFKVSYRVNGGAWKDTSYYDGIAAKGLRSVNVIGLDLSALGTYAVDVAVTNLHMADVVNNNDSIRHNIVQLPNDPVQLSFYEDFETLLSFESRKDTSGFGLNSRWDYEQTTDTGRIRSRVLNSVTIQGQSSISMDAYKSCPGNTNALIGTFNLANYKAADEEVRLEFDYILHGAPESMQSNTVLLRGQDQRALQKLYQYNAARENIGVVQNSGSISLSDLLIGTADDFSTSTQIQFGQSDNSVIASRSLGKGLTLDNVKIYTVQNDIQLLSIVTPDQYLCGVDGSQPLIVKVRNGVNQTLTDISVNYQLDGGVVVTEKISELKGKDSIAYSFTTQPDLSVFGGHKLDVWVSVNGDTYLKNDSILNYIIRNQPVVKEYPYVEDFEKGDGNWFAEGINSSWQYGSPSAPKIDKAASGSGAWVTNLTGLYNDNEMSYLYSPCLDLSMLSNPKMKFQLALDIEKCDDVLCDAAYVEYTTDGVKWSRLADSGRGTNWYNDTNYQVWTIQDKTMWHQADVYLPKGYSNLQLRFVLQTDGGSALEGIGIDDINIYNEVLYAPDDNIISISPNPTDNGIINIEWGAHIGTYMRIVMTDVRGKEVYSSTTIAEGEGYNKTTLLASGINTGIYFMRITIGNKEHVARIVCRRN